MTIVIISFGFKITCHLLFYNQCVNNSWFLFCSGSGKKSKNSSSFLDESSFFDEERLRDEHLRIAQKIHAAGNGRTENGPSFQDYAETCSEVNLSSRTSKNGKKIMHNGAKFIKKSHLIRTCIFEHLRCTQSHPLGMGRLRNILWKKKLCRRQIVKWTV